VVLHYVVLQCSPLIQCVHACCSSSQTCACLSSSDTVPAATSGWACTRMSRWCVLFLLLCHASLLRCLLFMLCTVATHTHHSTFGPCSAGVAPCVWFAMLDVLDTLLYPAVAVCSAAPVLPLAPALLALPPWVLLSHVCVLSLGYSCPPLAVAWWALPSCAWLCLYRSLRPSGSAAAVSWVGCVFLIAPCPCDLALVAEVVFHMLA
jgi:hypothetical protein